MQLSAHEENATFEDGIITLPGINPISESDDVLITITEQRLRELRVMPMEAFERELDDIMSDPQDRNFFEGK